MTFVPPRVDEDLQEWEREGISAVHFRPLVWTRTPPERPGYFWVRRVGTAEQIVVHVAPGDEFAVGTMEWSSAPVPTPFERRSR